MNAHKLNYPGTEVNAHKLKCGHPYWIVESPQGPLNGVKFTQRCVNCHAVRNMYVTFGRWRKRNGRSGKI